MQDSPQQRVVNLKRHCRQIHEGVCRAQRTLSTAKGKVATATFRLSLHAVGVVDGQAKRQVRGL